MRGMRTFALDPGPIPVPQTVQFTCEGRVCRVLIHPQPVGPRLNNFPQIGSAPELEVTLGEQFQIEGEPGVYRVVRQSGEADALMLEPIS
jgi:hypothetical protein